jgi:non-canonical (house-cleaning) NTP pyrophosphatase
VCSLEGGVFRACLPPRRSIQLLSGAASIGTREKKKQRPVLRTSYRSGSKNSLKRRAPMSESTEYTPRVKVNFHTSSTKDGKEAYEVDVENGVSEAEVYEVVRLAILARKQCREALGLEPTLGLSDLLLASVEKGTKS